MSSSGNKLFCILGNRDIATPPLDHLTFPRFFILKGWPPIGGTPFIPNVQWICSLLQLVWWENAGVRTYKIGLFPKMEASLHQLA